jgi:hypothetical protein
MAKPWRNTPAIRIRAVGCWAEAHSAHRMKAAASGIFFLRRMII